MKSILNQIYMCTLWLLLRNWHKPSVVYYHLHIFTRVHYHSHASVSSLLPPSSLHSCPLSFLCLSQQFITTLISSLRPIIILMPQSTPKADFTHLITDPCSQKTDIKLRTQLMTHRNVKEHNPYLSGDTSHHKVGEHLTSPFLVL